MRIGGLVGFQAREDWDRYEAAERGEDVPGSPKQPDSLVWDEGLRLAELLEDLEFDSIWTVEHRVGPYALIPNPLQFMSYLAGRLDRVDLGTMVVVLPWHNPLRVAEDVVLIDNMLAGSGRKFRLGVGRGAGRREFDALGEDRNESRQRFDESVEIIKLAWTEPRFSYHGEMYDLENVELRPQPRDGQRLVDSMYCAWGSPGTIPIAAALGLRPLIIPQKAFVEYVDDIGRYADARMEAGYEPTAPVVGTWLLCADTEEEAQRAAEKHLPEYADTCLRNYELATDAFKGVKGYEFYANQAETLKNMSLNDFSQMFIQNHVWGTPEQCVAKLKHLYETFHPEEVVLNPAYGDMPFDTAEKSLRLFAREALPELKEVAELEPLTPPAAMTS